MGILRMLEGCFLDIFRIGLRLWYDMSDLYMVFTSQIDNRVAFC